MDINELIQEENIHYRASISLINTSVELKNSLIYATAALESLKKGFQINDLPEEENMKNIIEKINQITNYIDNDVIHHVESDREILESQINMY